MFTSRGRRRLADRNEKAPLTFGGATMKKATTGVTLSSVAPKPAARCSTPDVQTGEASTSSGCDESEAAMVTEHEPESSSSSSCTSRPCPSRAIRPLREASTRAGTRAFASKYLRVEDEEEREG